MYEGSYKNGKRMENGLNGIRRDRRSLKELTRMGKKMDYGLNGFIMMEQFQKQKPFLKMGNLFLRKSGK